MSETGCGTGRQQDLTSWTQANGQFLKVDANTGLREASPRFRLQGEWGLLILDDIPAHSVEDGFFDVSYGYAFVGELFRLPGLPVRAPGEDGVVADKEEQILRGERANLQHWPVRHHGEAFGVGGTDHVGVAA